MVMANHSISRVIFFFLFFLFLGAPCHAAYNVMSYGAKPDGKSDSTAAFLKAWGSACGSAAAATVHVPKGTFVVRNVVFGGPCKNKITFQIDGTIVAPPDFRLVGNSGYWILFNKVSRVTVVGGTVDGRGAGFWSCRRSGKNCPAGTRVSSSQPLTFTLISFLFFP